jgi:endonuclease YncB( thermonuclease family)
MVLTPCQSNAAMRPLLVLTLAAACLAKPALAMPLPGCAGGVEVAQAKIMRVEKNGALILNDGRAVMLEGIRLPLTDRGPAGLADDALTELRALAMAAPLTLAATPPKEDRYDRVRVQAFGDSWIQTELLKRGLARVELASDRGECAAALYAAEKQARTAGAGLWAFPAFAVRKPGALTAADEGSFQIVEGKVVDASDHDGRVFLDFSSDYRSGFSATIAPEDHKAFRGASPAIEEIAGHIIRLRGMVEDYGGRPEIGISDPAQIEFLQ